MEAPHRFEAQQASRQELDRDPHRPPQVPSSRSDWTCSTSISSWRLGAIVCLSAHSPPRAMVFTTTLVSSGPQSQPLSVVAILPQWDAKSCLCDQRRDMARTGVQGLGQAAAVKPWLDQTSPKSGTDAHRQFAEEDSPTHRVRLTWWIRAQARRACLRFLLQDFGRCLTPSGSECCCVFADWGQFPDGWLHWQEEVTGCPSKHLHKHTYIVFI